MNKNLIAAIITAIGLFLFFTLILPEYNGLKNTRGTFADRQALLNERKTEVKNFQNIDALAKSRQGDISKILIFLPSQKRLDEIVSSIQRVAGDSGLQLVGMAAGDTTSLEDIGYKKVFLNVDLNGRYPAFVNFLKSLEQSLRLFDVSEITAASSGGGLAGSVDLSLKMYAYYINK